MRRALIPLVTTSLTALGAPPLSAQQADRARIDEFSVPADTVLEIEQVDPAADTRTAGDVAPASAPVVAQITRTQDDAPASPPAQLSAGADRRDLAARSISTAADSRPQPAAAIAGRDRCDPRAEDANTPECRNTLERRAREFAAAEAPRLTAEQALLATRRIEHPALGPATSEQRVRRVGTATAAEVRDDERANQELATIYLARQRAGQAPAPEPAQPDVPDALNAVVEALRQGATPSP